jgi:hypothetical protein
MSTRFFFEARLFDKIKNPRVYSPMIKRLWTQVMRLNLLTPLRKGKYKFLKFFSTLN